MDVFVFLVILNVACGFDYCKLCNPPGSHTMCKYPDRFASKCTNAETNLAKDMKKLLLEQHNMLRNMLALGHVDGQPSASNMMKLKWNDEAGQIARRWLKQCEGGHDKCRAQSNGDSAGQNGFWASRGGNINMTSLMIGSVGSWFSEHERLTNLGEIDKFSTTEGSKGKGAVGHYTQLVWAKTSQVGCAFNKQRKPKSTSANIYCNYVPAGNMIGAEMYKRGKACSECPEDTKCGTVKYTGLCIAADDTEEDDMPVGDDKDRNRSARTTYSLLLTLLHIGYFVVILKL